MQNFRKKKAELIFAIIAHFVCLMEFTFAIKGQNLKNIFCKNMSWKNVMQKIFPSMYSKNGIDHPFLQVFLCYLKLKIITEIFDYNNSFYNNLPLR